MFSKKLNSLEISKFKVPFIHCRHHQHINGYQSILLPINTFIFLSVHSTSKKIFLLPLGQFDIIGFDWNHKFVGCDSIEVYQNKSNNFKLSRNASFVRWAIILGGWGGSRSLIKTINSDASLDKICTDKSNSKNDFNILKENFQVIVADKSITIKNHDNGEIFMKCSDEEISKFHLTHMSVSSGSMQSSGNIQIERIKGLLKL